MAKTPPKDHRYELVHVLIVEKKITSFNEVFNHIPISVVMRELSKSVDSARNSQDDPGRWKVREIVKFAELFGVSHTTIWNLIMADLKEKPL